MSRCLFVLAALAAVLMPAAACSPSVLPNPKGSPHGASGSPGKDAGGVATLAEGTCWTGAELGADPQDVLELSASSGVPYLLAARAVAGRPAFSHGVSCADDHAVEVYKVVRLPVLAPKIADYAVLLRTQAPVYGAIQHRLGPACMTTSLATAASRTGLPGAVMSPMLPTGASVGWAPASPAQWAKGQRLFACTLTWSHPERMLYASVFTKGFATGRRTCIVTKTRVFVDCARPHDRERIAVIEARDAVGAGAFPGPKAVKDGPQGRYLDVTDDGYRPLDAACTAYLHTISTTQRLSGVANVDVDQWPTPTGSFPIYCDADRSPDQEPLTTRGSVYDR